MSEDIRRRTIATSWKIVAIAMVLRQEVEYLSDLDFVAPDGDEEIEVAHALAYLSFVEYPQGVYMTHQMLSRFADTLQHNGRQGLFACIGLYKETTAALDYMEGLCA